MSKQTGNEIVLNSKEHFYPSKNQMESKTFARTSARRYRIVDAEER
jgi:hypothetical protein